MSLGPAGGTGAGVVVVVAATVGAVVVAVVVTVAEVTVEVVVTAGGGVLTMGMAVLVDVGVVGSTLFRGRRTLVITSGFVVLDATGWGSALSFSTVGAGVMSSLAAKTGLLAAFGLASELGVRISGLSLMFSLIGGKLPNVLLF